jgi:formate dehydrogenase alpha subunit
VELIKLTIDDREVQVPAGTTVLNAAEAAGILIPRLCYDPALSLVGACRLCVVEIDGIRNLPASCVTWVAPGMVVRTNTPAVIEARKTVLELLIANHPLDCLTCEKLGECKLAEYCYLYGIKGSPFLGDKHSYDLEEDNPFIVRDLNKCIVCGKCIRACAEVTGKNILDFAYRGFNTKVTPFGDISYSESDCIFCGNCVSFCPVGALTEKQMRRKGRRFEIKKVRTTCTFCGAGCNFNLCVKDGKVVGVTSYADSPVNGNALCIRGRFATREFIHSDQRLTTPLIRKDGRLVPASWDEALDLVAERLQEIREVHGPDSFAAVSSARITNEENYLVQKFARAVMGTNNVDYYARTCHAARGCEDPTCEPIAMEFTHVTLLRCQNNTQGASDMGALAGALPGYQRVVDQGARSKFESAWGVSLPGVPGLTIQEMFAKANDGALRAMFILGDDPVRDGLNSDLVRSGLSKLEFLVVQDLFLSETTVHADVVLPAASFAETDGTFTNTRRRVQRVRKAIEPLAGKTNWQVLADLSARMGCPMNYLNPEQIYVEMASLAPLFAGYNYAKMDAQGLQWP